MFKLLAGLILSLSGVVTVVYIAPSSYWHGWDGDHHGSRGTLHAPEIDPASAASALTLLMGGVLVLRSRSRAKR